MSEQKQRLLDLYEEFPFHDHPLWRAIKAHELSYEQVIRAEVQHVIRTRAGQKLRADALAMAESNSPAIFEQLLQTYLEECTADASGPSHLDLIRRLVMRGGWTEKGLAEAIPTPGNAAAIALYRDITTRGAGCHMLGAGAVEHYYSQLSPKIFEAYTVKYGMSAEQAETYRIHGHMDECHAERAFAILDEAVSLHTWESVQTSVRDAFVATSLHYDGMLQAATGTSDFWNGRD
ncbi:MAG TPA: iron-containing redox enzyme family protein [Candidatus Saccharimonadales bacterium]|jgi:pyrroloquinoline quinone (PQQ) biosynthesis protein C|nr:iron-containing redox enzyme family protein [Candidatus Saccharimonadales bacterium]